MVFNSVFNNVWTYMYNVFYSVDNKFYYLSLIKEKDSYSIHGLWPQYDKGNYPTYCRKVNFSINKLTPIINELNMYWNSYKENNDDFWKHEYEKHGSCMFKQMDEFTYFNTTLKLYKEAIALDIADMYYNEEKDLCLIPVGLELKIIDNKKV